MAKLKIYNEIVDEETKIILEGWFGINSVCYSSVKDFIEQIPEDDGDIDVHLHCPGGSCIEGFAIYDALRTSGKRITTVVDGMCASMATVIMMAAPKERRFCQKNASFCIHNPYIPDYFNYTAGATADDLDNLAKKVQIQAEDLRNTQEKILNIYVERTGSSKEDLQALMDEDRWIDSARAIELGLIGETLEPNTDNKNIKAMEKVTVEASVFAKMLAKLGIKKVEDLKDMVITAADGSEITVDRSEGDPQVGDKATPDGSFLMADGRTINVQNGEITAIEEPVDERDAKIASLTAQVETLTKDAEALKANAKTDEDIAAIASVATLTTEKTALETKVKDLEAANATLTADAKTDSEKSILAKVAEVAGEMDAVEWLSLASKASSTFIVDKPGFNEGKGNDEPQSIGAEFLAAKRANKKSIAL